MGIEVGSQVASARQATTSLARAQVLEKQEFTQDDPTGSMPRVIFSFDVEEHHRIEAAAGLTISPTLREHYRERLRPTTQWLLDELDRHNVKATFFILGDIARHSPALVRAIHREGHEVASHGWDHRRVTTMTPDEFRQDLRLSKDALEQVTGEAVLGYRAPTFSIGPANPWAIDVLVEEGFEYDSSIFPVRHDRYGVPGAPSVPFLVRGERHELFELPPATWRIFGMNLPMGGGGYFRLFPLWCTRQALRQAGPAVAMLYFHPWEFDAEQSRLPLKRINRFRTYVGVPRARNRLAALLRRQNTGRTIDLVRLLARQQRSIRRFGLINAGNY